MTAIPAQSRAKDRKERAVIDFHSHILPRIDDGSQSVKETLALLRILSGQGVDLVAATPHFYASRQPLAHFLEKREEAYEQVRDALRKEPLLRAPEIRLGAEVWYYPGVSRLEEIRDLRLQGTKLLLLEMPAERWSGYMLQEVLDLNGSGALTVVLAHIERCLPYQTGAVWDTLLENGVMFQVNASFLLEKRRALKWLKRGEIQWLGSDCHNLGSRAPHMGEAFEFLRKKLGDGFLAAFDAQNRSYFV